MKSPSDQKLLKKFGLHLRRFREARHLSLRQLADEADIDFSAIHRIETGETNTSFLMIYTLAAALNITPAELITIS